MCGISPASLAVIPHIIWKNEVTKCTVIDGASRVSLCLQCSLLMMDELMTAQYNLIVFSGVANLQATKLGAANLGRSGGSLACTVNAHPVPIFFSPGLVKNSVGSVDRLQLVQIVHIRSRFFFG